MSFKLAMEILDTCSCRGELVQKLMGGDKVVHIIKWMQEEKGVLAAYSPNTARKYLYHWMERNGVNFLRSQPPQALQNLVEAQDQTVDPVDVYQLIMALQTERVLLVVENEKNTGRITESGNRAIALLERICKNLADIETDRTVRYVKRVGPVLHDHTAAKLQGVKDRLTVEYGEKIRGMALDPAARRKILNVLELVRGGYSGTVGEVLDKQISGLRSEEAGVIDLKKTEDSNDSGDWSSGDDGGK